MSVLFQFKDATISIGTDEILKGIDFTIKKGDHTWITGANGSGKTTLCKAIVGKLRISKGVARPINTTFDKIKMVSFTDDGKLFHSVNNQHYYQQRFNSWDSDGHLTVRDYLIAKGVTIDNANTSSFIERFDLLPLLELERIKLSSGQTRKMLLASALLKEPELLILDNAYIGLDTSSKEYLNDFLDTLVRETNTTLIITGHYTSLPTSIQRFVSIEKNALTFFDKLKQSQGSFYNKKNQVALLRKLKNFNFKNQQHIDETEIASFQEVTIGYKQQEIIKIKKWEVVKGEKWSVLGANGSGKSTLVSMIYGDHPQVYAHSIKLFGFAPGKGRSVWDIKKLIGFTSPELHAFFRYHRTAIEIICTGLFDSFEVKGDVPNDRLNYIKLMASFFDVNDLLDIPYFQLSTGQQRLCLFMRALVKCPVLFLLDEPFQGLDPQNTFLARELLNTIITPEQSMIFISHFAEEIPSSIDQTLNL